MSGDYLADSPEHEFRPQDRLPDRCGFVSDGMLCGYDRKCHEALWPREPATRDRAPTPRLLTRPCARHDFADHHAGGTCPDCGHLIMAHVGTDSCVVCRMEYQLSPQYRRQQQRIHGTHPRDMW